jgi:hypothetical protein
MADVPVLIFGGKELLDIAGDIRHAQMAGWERILTCRGPLPNERDEYPFARTIEASSRLGNRSVWVNPVPAWENSRASPSRRQAPPSLNKAVAGLEGRF